MKIIIKEPEALRGVNKEGKSKANEYIFDSDISTNCQEIIITLNKFGMLCTKVKKNNSFYLQGEKL